MPGIGAASPSIFLVDARHDAQQRGLARAVQAEQADLGAREEREGDVLDDLALGRDDLAHADHRITYWAMVFRACEGAGRLIENRPRCRAGRRPSGGRVPSRRGVERARIDLRVALGEAAEDHPLHRRVARERRTDLAHRDGRRLGERVAVSHPWRSRGTRPSGARAPRRSGAPRGSTPRASRPRPRRRRATPARPRGARAAQGARDRG